MPSWWFEATLPSVAFVVMFVLWVVLPGRPGERDLGSRIRDRIWRR